MEGAMDCRDGRLREVMQLAVDSRTATKFTPLE